MFSKYLLVMHYCYYLLKNLSHVLNNMPSLINRIFVKLSEIIHVLTWRNRKGGIQLYNESVTDAETQFF